VTKTPQEEENEMTEALLLAVGITPEMRARVSARCSLCRRGWVSEDGRVHCGAHPDMQPKPVWAKMKYSLLGLFAAVRGTPLANTDCENLDDNLAEKCEAFEYGKEGREQTSTEDQEGPEA